MKLVKRILAGLLALIAIVLIAALFVKKDYRVEREITISKPKQQVFDYIRYIKNQDNFSKWNQMDPNMKKSYKGEDGTVGFVYSWESENEHVGKGEQELVKIEEGNRIDMALRFKEPFEAQDDAYMITTSIDSTTTKVVWGFSGAFPYPMNLMTLFLNMDEAVGNDLGTGLTNLKGVLEKQ